MLTRTIAFPLKSLASHCSSFGKAVFDTQLQPQSHAKKHVYSRIESAQIYHRRNVCLFQRPFSSRAVKKIPEPAQVRTSPPPATVAQNPADPSPAHKYFTDVVLINQNGEKMRFYSDLLKGKVVVINSFFATCQGSCLPMNRNLEKVQEALGDHVGKDVLIISISVDPTVDTPASLKDYAKKLHAWPGWYFLTGDKQNVDFALNKLGQFVSDKQDHLNIFIIGNERTGLWKKA